MIIVMYDGSRMECEEIEFTRDGNIFADEYRIIPIVDVVRITSD